MTTESIPFHRPSISEAEICEVVKTLCSGWLTTGPRTQQFETEFREYVRARHSLAVNSCTAGLHLALVALGIKPGDEVITTPLTFCATVNTILQAGATPVLADIGKDGNIDPESIRQRITNRTRAILPVHYAGFPCDMAAIWSIARSHGLLVIEDAAHAVGTWYQGRPIGCSDGSSEASDAVVFSFYATKNLTTGEGGMVTTPHAEVADRMKLLCLHGISRDAWNRYSETGNWYYEVEACGFKYNLSDLQSAVGIHQLRRLEGFIETRRRYAEMYESAWRDLPELELPREDSRGRSSWHLYPLRLNLDCLSIDRALFIEALRANGIGAGVHFIPIPMHPAFAAYPSLAAGNCPRVMELYPRLVSIPLYPAMSETEVHRVASAVTRIVKETSSVRSHSMAAGAIG